MMNSLLIASAFSQFECCLTKAASIQAVNCLGRAIRKVSGSLGDSFFFPLSFDDAGGVEVESIFILSSGAVGDGEDMLEVVVVEADGSVGVVGVGLLTFSGGMWLYSKVAGRL